MSKYDALSNDIKIEIRWVNAISYIVLVNKICLNLLVRNCALICFQTKINNKISRIQTFALLIEIINNSITQISGFN